MDNQSGGSLRVDVIRLNPVLADVVFTTFKFFLAKNGNLRLAVFHVTMKKEKCVFLTSLSVFWAL